MKLRNYILTSIVFAISLTTYSQSGLQKKADNLFNKFAFVGAAETYQELIAKNYNVEYATRQLADSYAYMRNPDSAVVYYKKAIEHTNIPISYYYNYAQALRGVKNYKESRDWLKKYKNAGGELNEDNFLKDADFINSIFSANQQYILKEVKFNSKYSDFGAYEKNGDIYFASSRDEGVSTKHKYGWNNEPFLDIYKTTKSSNDSIVNHKSKLKGNINTAYHEGPLTISNDGKTMYFSRNNFNNQVLGENENGENNLKIYKTTLVDNKWIHIEELPFNSDSYSNGHPALNNDGSKLYFTSDMPGGYGGTDIYFVDINSDGTYGTPKNIGNVINTNKNESFPFLNSENVLFFSSDGHPGLGLLDVFGTVSDKNNQIISVINLGVPVNSNKDDFSFFMNEDGLSGFFASNRDGGVGSDDIYSYNRIPPLKIEGNVTDAITNNPVTNAIITLLDSDNNLIATIETDDSGNYEINIDRNTDYTISTKKENYLDDSKPVTSKELDSHIKSIKTNIVLNHIPLEDIPITELYPIYFDFNKFDIRKDGNSELDRIVNLMTNDYPQMVIKIESHTDSRGSSEYNNKLSEERAKSTYKYLVSKGVDPLRITAYNGYGEQKLTNDCDDNLNCTEEQHQLNRRTQFIVIKIK